MPLTLTAYEERKLNEAGLETITYVSIIPAVGTAYHFCSGTRNIGHIDADYLDWIQNLDDVSAIDIGIDPITRKTQIGVLTVRLVDDGTARALVTGTTVKGARVNVKMGPADDPSQQLHCWQGVVDDVTMGDGFVTIKCADDFLLAGDVQYYGLLVGEHPLEVADLVLDLIGIEASRRDPNDFDPRTDRAISHFNVTGLESIADANDSPGQLQWDPSQPTGYVAFYPTGLAESGIALKGSAIQYLDTVALHCGGSIWKDERGRVRFRRYVAPTAVHDTWDEYDILSLEVLQTMDGMINEVQVHMGFGAGAKTYIYRDNQSQADHRHPSAAARKAVLELKMPLAGAELRAAINSNSATAFGLEGVGVAGMSGARVDDTTRHLASGTTWGAVAPFVQPEGANLAEGRFVYIQADGEIIRVSLGAIDPENLPAATFGNRPYHETNELGAITNEIRYYPRTFDVTLATRGYGGTTAAAHGGGNTHIVRDVTAPRMLAEVLVERCRNGLPKLKVRTTLAKFRYTVGDFIALTTEEFFWWGASGTYVNALWWEVTRKQTNTIEGWIAWELTFAKLATPQSTSDPEDVPRDNAYQSIQEDTLLVGGKWNISANQTFESTGGKGGAGAQYTILWNEEIFAGVGTMDPDTGVWTCQRDGLYRIHAKVAFDATGVPDGGAYLIVFAGEFPNEVAFGPEVLNGVDSCFVDVTIPLDAGESVVVAVNAWFDTPPDDVVIDADHTTGFPITFLEISYVGPLP